MEYYLAGPMTGRPYHNMHAFQDAADVLRDAGYNMVVPVELDGNDWMKLAAQDPTGLEKFADMSWGDFLARDVKVIADSCDAIVMLPEWETSKGARLEVFVAMTLGYPVYFYQEDGTLKHLDYTRVMDDLKEGIIL